jgi:phage terminase small subunit
MTEIHSQTIDRGGLAAIPQIGTTRVAPLLELDEERKRLWRAVEDAFAGMDHLRTSDTALMLSYVDAVLNYLRVRRVVEERWDHELNAKDIKLLLEVIEKQGRFVGALGRELGFGPLARRHMGTFIKEGGAAETVEAFSATGTGRRR